MKLDSATTEHIKLWQAPDLDGLELIHARYRNQRFDPHFHDTYSIGMLEQRAMAFQARGAVHTASRGQITIINPGVVHTGEPATEGGWQYRSLYPSIASLKAVARELTGLEADMPYFPLVFHDPQLSAALRALHQSLETPGAALERQSVYLMLLATLIHRHADARYAPQAVRVEHRAVLQAKAFLRAHVSDDVSLEELTHVTGLSPFYLVRVFKQQTGLPPHRYQTQLRVELAKQRLRAGADIATVALDVGFADQSHLTRKFKAVVGVTPGQYVRHAR
jgi:AraC-like DNA-binding protein